MENSLSFRRLSIITLMFLLLAPMVALASITDVSLVSPVDTYNTTDTTPIFSFNATSDSDATFNCTLYLNSTSYANNATTANITDTNLTASTISTDGTYEWWITCTDSVNSTNSTKRDITIDSTAPTTSSSAVLSNGSSYTFGDGTNLTYVNVTLTCSDGTGIGCDTILYCNDTDGTCTPSAVYSSVFNVSAEAVNYVRYLSNDTLGNDETVNSVVILIDRTYPLVAYVDAPTAGNAYESVTIKVSFTEINLDTCTLVWAGTEETFASNDASSYWETKSLAQGTAYTFYAFCNDSTGQTNTTSSISIYGKQTTSGGGGGGAGTPNVLAPPGEVLNPVSILITPAVVDLKVYDDDNKIVYSGAFRSGSILNLEDGTYNFVMTAEGYQRHSVMVDAYEEQTLTFDLKTIGMNQSQADYRQIVFVIGILALLYLILTYKKD